MLFQIFLIVTLSSSIQCSIVIETDSQKGVYVSDYCPKMKYCPEGAHVMCMYYNPKSVSGPRCRNFRNITMTTDIANKLLDVTNAVRSKIARGQEKGEGGQRLPRGYGIFRLRWDSELATFAQVTANQCLLRRDLCRATKKFPDPGQVQGLVRFSVPDWIPVSKSGNFTRSGLDDEKLMYATTQSLKNWYAEKSSITSQMVTSYPGWSKDPLNVKCNLYSNMIYGPATHMGCGMAAYTEYAFYDNGSPLTYNSVQVVCNFSARPRAGTAVFSTVPPSDTESPFNPCGCPAGSIEDDDCLCHEIPHIPEPLPAEQQKGGCPGGINCDPTIVLLPIFTVEDAPPSKLISSGSGNSSVGRIRIETQEPDSFEALFDNSIKGKGILQQTRQTFGLAPHSSNGQKQRPLLNNGVTIDHNRRIFEDNENRDHVIVKDRYFDAPKMAKDHAVIRSSLYAASNNDHKKINPRDRMQTYKPIQKSSIFSKTPIFELPGAHYYLATRKIDVVPRKDFSVGKQLVNKYLYNKNNVPIITSQEKPKFLHSHENVVIKVKSGETVQLNNDLNHPYMLPQQQKHNLPHHEDVHFHDILTTETNLNTAEKNVMNHNKEIIGLNLSHEVRKQTTNHAGDTDKKLMNLLDTLEQEVNHIELHDKEKQIFDAKIKKIYGKVVGKASPTLAVTAKPNSDIKTEDHDLANKDSGVHSLPPSFDAPDDESNFIDEPGYRNHDTDPDIDKFLKYDVLDVDIDDVERPMISKTKSHVPHDTRVKYSYRGKNNVRSRNRIDSFEFSKQGYSNGYKTRKSHRNVVRNDLEKLKHRNINMDFKRKSYFGEAYEEPLSIERRKYYQDKLDSMERKLQDVRRYNGRRKEPGRSSHMRALKPSLRSDNQINPLYAGRARILHGY